MPIAITKKPKFIVFLTLWFAFSLFIFLSYRGTSAAHEWVITPLALKTEFSFPNSWFASLEVQRRIDSGKLQSAEFLLYVLSIAAEPGIDSEKAYALADRILEAGLYIDSYDVSMTPLHAAVNANDSGAVAYLLIRCADPFVPTKVGGSDFSQQMNAFELLNFLQGMQPDVDRSGVAHIMEQWKPSDSCTGR